MDEFIRISCPSCGKVLRLKDPKDKPPQNLTCPLCKTRSPYFDYKPAEEAPKPTKEAKKPVVERKETGTTLARRNEIIGCLMAGSVHYSLHEGKNVIGRSAQSSQADIQLPNPTNRMSREHCVVEVEDNPVRGYVHRISLCKPNLNPTYIGATRLEYGDVVELEPGMVIRLPDTELVFS